jgi:hypothetical protein
MGNRTGPDPGGLPNPRKRHEKGRAGEQARPFAFVPVVGESGSMRSKARKEPR